MEKTIPHLSHPKYRPDIDGLRAIAVLFVVAFHAFPAWIKGGFIGVDVFFVISGFLISTIIFENLEKNTFSFSEFYARRIKRIFPALLLVLVASYAFGWFSLLADEYKQLGKHIASGAGFISNFILWGESGYFDNTAETKPLLHLWSLGIEEQFYIIWPFLLWLSWKVRFNSFALMTILALTSYLLNTKGIKQDSVATFYSPQTRFWELLSGSILAWLVLYKKNTFAKLKLKIDYWLVKITRRKNVEIVKAVIPNILSFLGCVVLAYGFWRVSKNVSFPGSWALVPVAGAFLIILAGPTARINRNVLSNKILVWFGLISFPLYLWHWPVLSFARIVESETPSRKIRLAAVVLSVVLAWCTYRFIEQPIRSGKRRNQTVSILVSLMIAAGGIGYYTYSHDGLAFRDKDREDFVKYFENSFPNWGYFKKINLPAEWREECSYFDEEKYLQEGKLDGGVANSRPVIALDSSCYKRNSKFSKSVLVWGDSHAQALSPGLIKYMPSNWQVLQIASSGCLPDPSVVSPSLERQCVQSNYFAIKVIREAAPDVVVVAQATGHSVETMAGISHKLKELGVKRVLFLGPTPQWTSDLPKIIARQLWLIKPRRTYIGINQEVIAKNNQLSREFGNANPSEFVDVIGLFCSSEGCLTYTGDDLNKSITTWDYGHLTPSASKYLAQHLLVRRITIN
ncbi:acyltransferase family protein [Chitiniphilus shinanonensis]|uniref:acyltransferase family protein n=1 Tax=Chitiniphilus shinanonensis TaxID=553088 RepID=UPI0033413DE7